MIIDEFKNLIRGKASREGGSCKNLIRFPRINWRRIAVLRERKYIRENENLRKELEECKSQLQTCQSQLKECQSQMEQHSKQLDRSTRVTRNPKAKIHVNL